jgi:hypothetical protein
MGTLRRLTQGAASTFIDDAAIASAKIADLTADKISSGTIKVGTYIQSSNYESGVPYAGWAMNYLGQAEFNDVYVRGVVASSVVQTSFLQNDVAHGQPGSAFMDLRPNTPAGWLLYKRRPDGREVGIVADGSTRFANTVVTFAWLPLGVYLDTNNADWYEFSVDTGVSASSFIIDSVLTPALRDPGIDVSATFPGYAAPDQPRAYLDFQWSVGSRQFIYSNGSGFADMVYSRAVRAETLVIHGKMRIVQLAGGSPMNVVVGGIYYGAVRVT